MHKKTVNNVVVVILDAYKFLAIQSKSITVLILRWRINTLKTNSGNKNYSTNENGSKINNIV